MEIKILDSVHCQTKDGIALLKPLLSYKAEFWQRGRFGKRTRREYRKYLIDKEGVFLTGLLSKVKTYCKRHDIPFTVEGEGEEEKLKTHSIGIPGITFRQDQIDLIGRATQVQRGVIKAPTGSGKSIIMMGIISAFPEKRFLLLAHTLDIVNQLQEDVDKFKFSERVDVGTIQSWANKDPIQYCDMYQGAFIDEAHHLGNPTGIYTKVLHQMLAPLKIGFTATLPTRKIAQMTLEGTLGSVIGELTIEEAVEKGIIARPRIRLIKVPKNEKIRKLRKYQDVYETGIVLNRARNRLIIKETKKLISEGNTVLILVVRISHGDALVDLAKRLYGLNIPFVQGVTDSEVRDQVKKKLKNKSIKVVIATAVFREGVNIPSLNVIINSCGGKSEIMTLQAVGRGLRATEDKKEAIVIDFLDLSHYYLINHVGERLSLYSDMGWL